MTAVPQPFRVGTLGLDLPAVAGAFGRRLHDAGVPVTAERAAWFARGAGRRASRSRAGGCTGRRAPCSCPTATQVQAFDCGVRERVRLRGAQPHEPRAEARDRAGATDRRASRDRRARWCTARRDSRSSAASGTASSRLTTAPSEEIPVPVLASDEEVLRTKRFDALEPDELAQLYRLMTRLRVATPVRRTRRAERDRHGERIDMRRTLRGSLRTGGDPIRLARRRRRVVRRRLVLLCDISGSMEPYARAYLQFLTVRGRRRGRAAARRRSCSPPG